MDTTATRMKMGIVLGAGTVRSGLGFGWGQELLCACLCRVQVFQAASAMCKRSPLSVRKLKAAERLRLLLIEELVRW